MCFDTHTKECGIVTYISAWICIIEYRSCLFVISIPTKKINYAEKVWSSRGLTVKIYNLSAVCSNPRKVNGGDRKASDLNSLLSSKKASLLTSERTPRPSTGNIGSINSATQYREYQEYKLRDPVQGISGV